MNKNIYAEVRTIILRNIYIPNFMGEKFGLSNNNKIKI